MFQQHTYHLVDPSPYPLIISTGALMLVTGTVGQFHGYSYLNQLIFFGLFTVLYTLFLWFRDVVRESTLEGQHTIIVQLGLRIGIRLFIVSEIIFFVAFFWAFFWSALAPTPNIGSVWPPLGIDVLNAWEVPFLNTLILLTSGRSVTWAHHTLLLNETIQYNENRVGVLNGRFVTILLATIFTILQLFEYINAEFTISDSVYGSTFYIATGFHGFHVIIGTCFLSVCRIRLFLNHITKQHHFGLEAAAWYWHFVDVVWLFLFVSMYCWGN